MGVRNGLAWPLFLFAGLLTVSVWIENQPRRFSTPSTSEFLQPAKVTFPVQLVLPKKDFGVLNIHELNADLFQLSRHAQQPTAFVILTDRPRSSEDFRLTIYGHRWSAWAPPPVLTSRADRQIDWVYLVQADWAPFLRTRLTRAGWDWTRLFLTTDVRIGQTSEQVSHEEILRLATTTQLRRWILNYIDPLVNPDKFR